MKSFVIKTPAKGRTTCSLVHQHYDKASRRTKTTYLGSVNIAANPMALDTALNLRPGVTLTEEQMLEVTSFLRVFGTWGKPPSVPEHVMQRARFLVAEEERARRLREKKSDLEEATESVRTAAQSLVRIAGGLRESGEVLSKGLLLYCGDDASRCVNRLDFLKVDANRLRSTFNIFEAALKEAGLIKRSGKRGKHRAK